MPNTIAALVIQPMLMDIMKDRILLHLRRIVLPLRLWAFGGGIAKGRDHKDFVPCGVLIQLLLPQDRIEFGIHTRLIAVDKEHIQQAHHHARI